MRMDSSEFDKGLDTSRKSFEGLRNVVRKGTQVVATAFAGTATTVGALGVAATKVGISYNGLRQTATGALKTLTGSAEEAADQMDRLDEFGTESWVMRDVLVRAQQQMTGFGIATEKVIPYLDGLQKGIAAAGKGNEEFSRAAEIMSEIQSTSKITGEHVRRLGLLGIDAAGAIGESMGKSGDEIREAITSGSLDAEEALDALAAGLSTKFPDAVENIRDTWDGATANMAGAWRDFGAELAKPLVDPKGGGYFVTWANDVADAFWALREKTAPVVDLLTTRFASGLESISPLLRSVKDTINQWDISKLNSQLDELGKYAPLIAGTSTALFAMGSTSLPLIGRFVPAINPLVAGLGAMVAFSPELRQMGADFFEALSPLAPIAKELGIALADTLMNALRDLTPALSELLVSGAEIAVVLGTALSPALVGLMEASVPLVGVLANIVSWIADLPTPLLMAAAAFTALQGPLKPLTKLIEGVALSFLQFGQRSQIHAALGQTNVAVGAMSVAMGGARTAARNLGNALKTAFISNPVGIAIAGLATAFGAFATAQANAKADTEEYMRTLDEFGRVTDDTMGRINEVLAEEKSGAWAWFMSDTTSAIDAAEALGIEIDTLHDYILGEADAVNQLKGMWAEYSQGRKDGTVSRDELDLLGNLIVLLEEESDKLTEAEKAQERKRRADEAAGIAQRDAASETREHTDAIKAQADALEDQYDKQRKASGEVLSASESMIRYNETVERATETIKENGKNLDLNTKEGRENQSALNDLARAGLDNVDAMRRNNATSDELRTEMTRIREDFIKNAKRAGANADEANRLADNLGLIPGDYKAKVQVEGAINAFNRVDALNRTLNTVNGKRVSALVAIRQEGQAALAGGGIVTKRADGGIDEAGRYVRRVPQVVTGGRNILWGEPETGWESYISGKPSQRQRNLAVMDETARRLGGMFIKPMADGGHAGPQKRERVAVESGQRPIYITINSVPTEHADETAKALNFALRTRGGVYSRR